MSTTFLVLGVTFLSIGYFRIFNRSFGVSSVPAKAADRKGLAYMAEAYGRMTMPCLLAGFACTFATMIIGVT